MDDEGRITPKQMHGTTKIQHRDALVKLPTHTPEDILNGNHKQLHGGKRNTAHQQTTNFIYMITRPEIGFADRPGEK